MGCDNCDQLTPIIAQCGVVSCPFFVHTSLLPPFFILPPPSSPTSSSSLVVTLLVFPSLFFQAARGRREGTRSHLHWKTSVTASCLIILKWNVYYRYCPLLCVNLIMSITPSIKESELRFTYPVTEESDSVLGGNWNFDDVAMDPCRTVFVVTKERFQQAVLASASMLRTE